MYFKYWNLWWLFNPSEYRRLEDIFRTSEKGHDVLRPNQTTSSRRLAEEVGFILSWKYLTYNVFKTSDLRYLVFLKTSDLSRLKDVWFMTFWRRLIYNFLKMSVKQSRSDAYATSKQIIFSYLVLPEIFRKF